MANMELVAENVHFKKTIEFNISKEVIYKVVHQVINDHQWQAKIGPVNNNNKLEFKMW